MFAPPIILIILQLGGGASFSQCDEAAAPEIQVPTAEYLQSDEGHARFPIRVFLPFFDYDDTITDLGLVGALSKFDCSKGGIFEIVSYIENRSARQPYVICNIWAVRSWTSFEDSCGEYFSDELRLSDSDEECERLQYWMGLEPGAAGGEASFLRTCVVVDKCPDGGDWPPLTIDCNSGDVPRITFVHTIHYLDLETAYVRKAVAVGTFNLLEIGALVFSGDGGVGAAGDAAQANDDGGELPDTAAPHANQDAGNTPPDSEMPEIVPGTFDGGSESFSAHRELAAGESCACAGSEPCGGSLLWILLLCLRGRRHTSLSPLPQPRRDLAAHPEFAAHAQVGPRREPHVPACLQPAHIDGSARPDFDLHLWRVDPHGGPDTWYTSSVGAEGTYEFIETSLPAGVTLRIDVVSLAGGWSQTRGAVAWWARPPDEN